MNPILLLDDNDLEFVHQFVIASGSLKELSKVYEVSYPTIRIRLNKVIEKLKISETSNKNRFEVSIMQMVIDEKLDLETAKDIINKYEETNKDA